MHPQALPRIIEILETDPDFFVPVKKLWYVLQTEDLAPGLTLEALTAELQADQRFEFTPGLDYLEEWPDDETLIDELTKEMEEKGFFSGPRVKLVSREMSPDDVFSAMSRSLNKMTAALQKAWDTRPAGDEDLEDQLLSILSIGQNLERELRGLVEDRPNIPIDAANENATDQ